MRTDGHDEDTRCLLQLRERTEKNSSSKTFYKKETIFGQVLNSKYVV
jgi:hypothetical protein